MKKPRIHELVFSHTSRADGFGALLSHTRKEKGVRLLDLSRRLGVTTATLSNIERGVGRPLGDEQIVIAATFLGIPAEPLIESAVSTRIVRTRNATRSAIARTLRERWLNLRESQLIRIQEILTEVSNSPSDCSEPQEPAAAGESLES